MDDLIKKSIRLEKYPLSMLISQFERAHIKDVKEQSKIIQKIQKIKRPHLHGRHNAMLIGWTGMPGVGKSSLLHAVCIKILEGKENLRIGVLAIDPTSHISGGSFLGDRTRVPLPLERKEAFFSVSSNGIDFRRAWQIYFSGYPSYARIF